MCLIRLPLVSIIIPCYNHGRFLSEAIDTALAQTHREIEVIVVDDGSTDTTSEVAAQYTSVRYVYQHRLGLSAARNRGVTASSGDFLIFLDADDRLIKDAASAGVDALAAHPECAFVYGRCRGISSDGSPLPTQERPRVEAEHYLALLRDNFIFNPAMVMYRREVFDRVGGFNSAVNASADYDIYLRVTQRFRVYGHNALVSEYRQHDSNMSSNAELMLRTTLNVLRSQRAALRGNRTYLRAYRDGIRHWQEYFGDRLVNDVRSQLRTRDWRNLTRALLVLSRYSPQTVVKHSVRKLSLLVFDKS